MMRRIGSALALAVMLVSFAAPAMAQGATLGRPGYGGPGCPDGTASVALSGNTLSFRFRAYEVAAGGNTGKRFERKACSVSVPIRVPRGRAVAIVAADYRGTLRLPAGTSATFRAEYFFAGGSGPVGSRQVNGPASGPFTLSTPGRPLVWSACGEDVTLRVNTSLRVTAGGGGRASASVRQQDIRNALSYTLRWRDC
jgi:hypothetical protein